MFVAMNRLTAPRELAGRIEQGFAGASGSMQALPGFAGFRLLRARDQSGDEALYIAETTWQDEASYQAWIQGDAFARAHSGASGGPLHATLELFDLVGPEEP